MESNMLLNNGVQHVFCPYPAYVNFWAGKSYLISLESKLCAIFAYVALLSHWLQWEMHDGMSGVQSIPSTQLQFGILKYAAT